MLDCFTVAILGKVGGLLIHPVVILSFDIIFISMVEQDTLRPVTFVKKRSTAIHWESITVEESSPHKLRNARFKVVQQGKLNILF